MLFTIGMHRTNDTPLIILRKKSLKKVLFVKKNKNHFGIVISHQEKIINMADRIMIIDGGEIKKIGTKDEVLPYLNGVQKCHKCVERLEGRA